VNLNRRNAIALSIVCVTMSLGGAWAWGYLNDERSAASNAARELADCRALGREISGARQTAAAAPRPSDITSAIAAAAEQAGLADGSLDHIDPGSARRNPDGTSSQRQIDLSIRQASLRQIVAFARALSVPPLTLTVERMRLSPSEADGGGWAADMTLTYRVSNDGIE
jgi:hypothetical protein